MTLAIAAPMRRAAWATTRCAAGSPARASSRTLGRRTPAPPAGQRRAGQSGQQSGLAHVVLEAAVEAMALGEGIDPAGQIADLARGSMRAPHQGAVDDDAHADAHAHRHEREGVLALARAVPQLTQGGQVDVVVDEHRHVEAPAQRAQRVKAPVGAEVVGERGHPPAAWSTTPGTDTPMARS